MYPDLPPPDSDEQTVTHMHVSGGTGAAAAARIAASVSERLQMTNRQKGRRFLGAMNKFRVNGKAAVPPIAKIYVGDVLGMELSL